MTLFCHALAVPQLERALSPARVASYQTLVGGGTRDAAIGAYVWGLELNSALAPLLSMVEVVLRNSLHVAATTQHAKADWYQVVLKKCGDRAWQTKVAATPVLAQQYYRQGVPPHNKKSIWVAGAKKKLKHWRSPAEGKLEDILTRLTVAGKPQTPDQVIAHAMFGFWLDLFEQSFESPTDPNVLWPLCQATAFPHNPAMSRAKVLGALVRIKQLRNRVSHHEPAWKLAHPLTPAGVNASLSASVREMCELLDAMAPDVTRMLETTGTLSRLRWLLDPQTIAAFAGQTTPTRVDPRALSRKVRKLAKAADRSLIATPAPQPGRAVEVQHQNRTVLTVLPHA